MLRNEWSTSQIDFYKTRAQKILNNIWNLRMISENGYICPGNNWGCDYFVNPSYFAPAWYRIFSHFDENPYHNWNFIIDKNYQLLQNTIGYNIGLVPDWTDINGNFVNDNSLGYNTYGGGRYFFKDAIRILFRLGIDYLWFKEPRAKQYLINAKNFIMNQGGAKSANFFRIESDDYNLPNDDIWIFDGGQKTRHRREHSHMTIAMWSIPIFLVGNSTEKQEFYNELGYFYESNKTYWGKTLDPINNEDIEHNEMYFDQFLAIFGALIMDNSFPNLEYKSNLRKY
jgi:endo-1,4-beta-D-glucanase Y